MEGMSFTELQPRDGETVVHCGHLAPGGHHWFLWPCAFRRPDGTAGLGRFRVCCNDCFVRHGVAFPVAGDFTWEGDEPVIVEDPGTPSGTPFPAPGARRRD